MSFNSVYLLPCENDKPYYASVNFFLTHTVYLQAPAYTPNDYGPAKTWFELGLSKPLVRLKVTAGP